MKNPIAGVCSLLTLTLVGPVAADGPRVVPGPDLVATGTVISVGNASMAIRTQDHGHPISFVVTTTTQMPPNVVVGSRVRVAYHAVGTTGQAADAVTLVQGPPVAAGDYPGAGDVQPAASQPSMAPPAAPAPQSRDSEPAGSQAGQLPATGSPLPAIGLLGLVAFIASLSLRALDRARS